MTRKEEALKIGQEEGKYIGHVNKERGRGKGKEGERLPLKYKRKHRAN